MKRTILLFALTTMIFAQEDGLFIPDEMTDAMIADSLFSVELLGENENTQENSEVTENLELAENVEMTEASVDANLGEMKINQEILLSINSENKTLVCDFSGNCNEKVIELVNLAGDLVFEISAPATENSISLPLQTIENGIYIIRVLSKESRRSIFSKAIVIG